MTEDILLKIRRFIVCGGRDFEDYATINESLSDIPQDAILVHGAARGADSAAARMWHDRYGGECESHKPDWKHLGKAAGIIRNQEMLDSGADLVVAFPGGRGTADMVRRAEKAGVPVRSISLKIGQEK